MEPTEDATPVETPPDDIPEIPDTAAEDSTSAAVLVTEPEPMAKPNADGVRAEEPPPVTLPLQQWQDALARANSPATLSVLEHDATSIKLRLTDKSLEHARYAAHTLIHAEDGREWRYLGDGPDSEDGTYSAYVRVTQ